MTQFPEQCFKVFSNTIPTSLTLRDLCIMPSPNQASVLCPLLIRVTGMHCLWHKNHLNKVVNFNIGLVILKFIIYWSATFRLILNIDGDERRPVEEWTLSRSENNVIGRKLRPQMSKAPMVIPMYDNNEKVKLRKEI